MKFESSYTFDLAGYGGDLFKVTPSKMDFGIDVDGIDEKAGPASKDLADKIQEGFKKVIKDHLDAQNKEFKSIILKADAAARKLAAATAKDWKGDKTPLQREADGVIVMINNAIKTLQSVVTSEVDKHFKTALDAIAKKLKLDIRKVKAKAWAKIAILAGIGLTGTAISLAAAGGGAAASIATAGGAVPITLAALGLAGGVFLTSIKAGQSIYSTYKTHAAGHKTANKGLVAALRAFDDAVKYEAKKVDKTLSIKEKIKLSVSSAADKKKAVAAASVNVNQFTQQMIVDLVNYKMEVAKVQASLDEGEKRALKAKAPPALLKEIAKQKTVVKDLKEAIRKAEVYIKDYEETLTEVERVQKQSTETFDLGALGKVVGKLDALASNDYVGALVGLGGTALSGVWSGVNSSSQANLIPAG